VGHVPCSGIREEVEVGERKAYRKPFRGGIFRTENCFKKYARGN